MLDRPLGTRRTILALLLSIFVISIPPLIISLLLIEIAFSFDIDVGVAAQLSTGASITTAMMALLQGVFSVKYRYKSLLLAGIAVLSVVSLSCYLAPTFALLLIVFAGTGISLALVQPMSRALIGQLFSMEARPQVIGYLNAGGASSFVIGSQILNVFDDWRLAFSLFLFPLTVVALVIAFREIPSTSRQMPSSVRYFRGLSAVLQNRSAIACVVANVLFIIAFRVISFYGIPFLRQQYFVDKSLTSLIVSGVALVFMVGSVMGGQLINRFGRKPLTVAGSVTIGILVFAFVNVPSLGLALIIYYLAGFTSSIRNAAYGSLALEQVSGYRGTMMSLSLFASHLAQAVGNGLGGLLLILFDYKHMGVLGITAFIAAFIFYRFTVDTTTHVT